MNKKVLADEIELLIKQTKQTNLALMKLVEKLRIKVPSGQANEEQELIRLREPEFPGKTTKTF